MYFNFHIKVWDLPIWCIEFLILHMNSGYNLHFGVKDLLRNLLSNKITHMLRFCLRKKNWPRTT